MGQSRSFVIRFNFSSRTRGPIRSPIIERRLNDYKVTNIDVAEKLSVWAFARWTSNCRDRILSGFVVDIVTRTK
jgi:hypothetical protein